MIWQSEIQIFGNGTLHRARISRKLQGTEQLTKPASESTLNLASPPSRLGSLPPIWREISQYAAEQVPANLAIRAASHSRDPNYHKLSDDASLQFDG
jgi:hypothetical protein